MVIDHADWRTAYVGLAVLVALIILPIAFFLLPDLQRQSLDGPVPPSLSRSGDALGGAGLTLLAAVCTRAFWLVTATFTLINGPIQLAFAGSILSAVAGLGGAWLAAPRRALPQAASAPRG